MQPAEAHIWKSTSEVQDYLYYKSCWIFLGGISIVIFEKKKKSLTSQNMFDGVLILKILLFLTLLLLCSHSALPPTFFFHKCLLKGYCTAIYISFTHISIFKEFIFL